MKTHNRSKPASSPVRIRPIEEGGAVLVIEWEGKTLTEVYLEPRIAMLARCAAEEEGQTIEEYFEAELPRMINEDAIRFAAEQVDAKRRQR
jgi:hypothetical protein